MKGVGSFREAPPRVLSSPESWIQIRSFRVFIRIFFKHFTFFLKNFNLLINFVFFNRKICRKTFQNF